MFINRDWKLSEELDFELNVQPKLSEYYWATPLYGLIEGAPKNSTNPSDLIILGWQLAPAYE